ncbi:MAG TPA: tail fiber domain-containing protein [Chitinophagaceae bacterium]|nr:tail fiber domain-containing protein [Chitinophagaceae bacterium]
MKQALTALAICIAMGIQAQNVGIGTSSPNTNAKLDITATDKGLLIPRMDSVHRKAISNTIGLLVYDSTTKSFWYNNGAAWQNMATSASGWSLTGNSGIDSSRNFLGTTDDAPLLFKVNNYPAGRIGATVVSIGPGAYSKNPENPNLSLTAIGAGALSRNLHDNSNYLAGFQNTAVGAATLANNTTGALNTGVGGGALASLTTGVLNTAVGADALHMSQTGGYNSAFGSNAMFWNSDGSHNTAIGYNAYVNGSFNTTLGSLARTGNTDLYNASAIGYNTVVDASNKIRLGNDFVTVVESNGVFNTVSDGRFKYNIREDVKGLDFIMNLRPVTYQFDAKKQEDFTKGIISAAQLNSHAIPAAYNENNGIKRTGFIAQEVEAAAQKTGFDFDGVKTPATDKQYYSLSYASFVVPLVKAMQEQQQVIDALKKQNDMMMKRLEALENKK